MTTAHDSPLGRTVAASADYDPGLLFPIPRAAKRAELGLGDTLPFHGVDLWNAYELSWLDPRGKPRVALGTFRVPAHSPNLIESKSLKLYLNSLNQARLADFDEAASRIANDLSHAAGATVEAWLVPPSAFDGQCLESPVGESIDDLPVTIDRYGEPDAALLRADPGEIVSETLVSDLLKSNCPVTGQPDWASLAIAYRGPRLDREALLRYLVAFRTHDDFHEQCVERVFCDLLRACASQSLTVHARYTRRGGLDINPWRSTEPGLAPSNLRAPRQ